MGSVEEGKAERRPEARVVIPKEGRVFVGCGADAGADGGH